MLYKCISLHIYIYAYIRVRYLFIIHSHGAPKSTRAHIYNVFCAIGVAKKARLGAKPRIFVCKDFNVEVTCVNPNQFEVTERSTSAINVS